MTVATADVARIALPALAAACREETEKSRRNLPAVEDFCLELLRRALCDRDDHAWILLVEQYRGLVVAWARLHPSASTEDADDLAARVFERFWRSIGAERFGQFRDVAAVLKYLKMCVHSVLMDEVRARRSRPAVPLEVAARAHDGSPAVTAADPAGPVADRLAGAELWAAILRELPDEDDRLVTYLSFVQDQKPAEIHSRFPERFPDVADVYRVKRNVVERLRRNLELRDRL